MRPEQAAELLSQTGIFGELDDQALRYLAEHSHVRSFKKASLIFQRGDQGDAVYVVVDGLVKIFVSSDDGSEVVLTTLRPPDVLGELAVIDGRPRSASAEAVKPTTLLALDRTTLLELLAKHPLLAEGLLKSLGGLIRRLTEQATDLVFLDVGGRLAKLLLGLADSDGIPGGDGIVLDLTKLKMTQTDLAGMVGTSRQAAVQVLQAFDERGYIERRGREIVLKDLDALRRRAAP
jgi:CRP/FNR family cyclic AMP-dependent transcriptional regulator